MTDGRTNSPTGASLAVAVVSGHAALGELIADALRRRGHRIGDIASTPDESMFHDEIIRAVPNFDIIVICTWNFPRGGRHFIRSVCTVYPHTRIAVIDASDEDEDLQRWFLSGATAVIGSRMPLNGMLDAIEGAAHGDSVIGCPPVIPSSLDAQRKLSLRETEILQLTVDGLGIAQIAQRLFISSKTVKHHLSASYAKLGTANRTEAVVTALRQGLVELHIR